MTEAHPCYREKPLEADDEELKGDEKKEAEKNNEAARLWISGLEAVNRKLGVTRVFDLSAHRSSYRIGYAEGTLFPWTMSDFSLMDAIECGNVKLPRVPVAENIPGNEMPCSATFGAHTQGYAQKAVAKLGPRSAQVADTAPHSNRVAYGHYEKTFKLAGCVVFNPPCFIIVCQNTAISKLI